MGQGVWMMTKTMGSRSSPNHQAKTQERKIKRPMATIAHGMTNIAQAQAHKDGIERTSTWKMA